jgi:mitochondrial import inner membrane translocase subunit TIM23
MYNGVNSSIDSIRGKHDILGSMGAGGITGAVFKSTGAFDLRLSLKVF